MECWVVDLGLMEYRRALDMQAHVVALRRDSKIPNTLLLLEHTHTYTIGRRTNTSHLLLSEDEMARRGIAFHRIDRGGEITYHGPGQLVGYPIMQVGGLAGIRDYLKHLEDVLIKTASDFGVRAERLPGYPGIWFGLEKLAAIGLRVTQGISKHGFAFNVTTDLSHFDGIVPCGLYDKGVTSLSEILGRTIPLPPVKRSSAKNFGAVFNFDIVPVPADELAHVIRYGRRTAILDGSQSGT